MLTSKISLLTHGDLCQFSPLHFFSKINGTRQHQNIVGILGNEDIGMDVYGKMVKVLLDSLVTGTEVSGIM